MYDLGRFPAVVLNGSDKILVEVAENIPDYILSEWDRYEGYYGKDDPQNLYNRVEIVSDSGRKGYIYVIANDFYLQNSEIIKPINNIVEW